MLCVDTYIGPSKIHGIGLFADEVIKKGRIICTEASGFDSYFGSFGTLHKRIRAYLKRYGYQDRYGWHLNADNMRFINHSDSPNVTASFTSPCDIAARDIMPSEELTVNYFDFDKSASDKLGAAHVAT